MVKKGQGALEFLMTYGWAFLVILIMIGALAYFGILNPKQFLPDRCSFGSEIQCRDYWLNETDVKIKLVNNVGATVQITDITATTPDGYNCPVNTFNVNYTELALGNMVAETYGNGDTLNSSRTNWQEGSTLDINLSACADGGVQSGDKFKFNIEVTWFDTKSSADYAHTTSGEIFRAVE
jgi:hypothetical protein